MHLSRTLAVAVLISLIAGALPAAATPFSALETDRVTTHTTLNLPTTRGWAFLTTEEILVTALGFFDSMPSGLASSHEVGIFAEDGTLLVSAIVPSGTSAELVDGFRYVPIDPLRLPSGMSFVVATTFRDARDTTLRRQDATGLRFAPGIQFLEGRYSINLSGLIFPRGVELWDVNALLNANFQGTVVPEPATGTLLATGLALIAWRRRGARPPR